MFHKYNEGVTKYACGVTILTEQFLLTAAHCTYEGRQMLPADRVFVKVGFSNMDLPEDHVRQFNVDRITRHEEYIMDTFENDIALLKLSCEITFTNYIQPVCLWQGDTQLSKIISKIGFVVGWGLHEGYSMPKKLSEATMPIVSSKKCWESDRWHYSKYYFESKTFCAGRRNGTHVNAGDSGSGLYMRMGSNWVLRGLISNAKTNPLTLKVQPDSYAIFTDVAYYLNWIKTKVPVIPHFAVDTEQITEIEFDSDANLLDLSKCGKYTHPSETQEEGKVLVNQYPWEVDIKIYDSKKRTYRVGCLGFLIHPTFVISMARCLKLHQNGNEIFAWINDFNGNEKSYSRIRIHDTFIHPDFSFRKNANDIAMAKLNRPATVNPICLPLLDPLELPDISQLHTIGVDLNDTARYFRNVTQLIDLEICQKQLDRTNKRMNLTMGHACSTNVIEDIDLMYYLVSAPRQHGQQKFFDGQYFLAAFMLLQVEVTSSEYFSVFTNVAYYSKWIRETIGQN
nr:polyserase-2-like [Aedes albopictus]